VILTAPLDGSIGVAVDSTVRAVFDREMDVATITDTTFTLTQGASTVNIATGGSGPTTLAGLRDAINAQSDVPVSATLVNSGGVSRLVLAGKSTGAANGFTATTDSGLASLGLASTQSASDASYSINGLALTSPSNTIKDAVDGVTVVLNNGPAAGSTAGTTADTVVTIAKDTDSIKSKVNDLISAYNAANSQIRSSTSYDATTKTAGQLNGEAVLRQAQSNISGVIRGAMTAAQSGDYTRASDIGLEVQKDGSLKLNDTKFDAAMAADPSKVQRLLAGPTGATGNNRGLAAQLRDQLDAISGTTGSLQVRQDGLRSQIKKMDSKQEQMQARLDQVQKRLVTQYSSLDTLLTQRQTDSNALANSLARL